jgi:hypothetical protein
VQYDLGAALPVLLPRAVAWAEARYKDAAIHGRPLNRDESALAQAVGVVHPELIRVLVADSLPVPDDPELAAAALETGLLGPGMVGLTLGYSVLVCRDHESTQLLSHEFRHVHQYERSGSIARFLPIYLGQILEFGYFSAPFEVDAWAHESTHRQ